MDKEDYCKQRNEILSDKNTYIIIDKDPTRKLTDKTRDIFARWKTKNYIIKEVYNKIYCSNGILPRTYEILKTQIKTLFKNHSFNY